MTHCIYKYPVEVLDLQQIEMPVDSRIMSVGLDPQDDLCLWAMVDTGATRTEDWQICVRGTGHPVSDLVSKFDTDLSPWRFLGSVTQRAYVWHVFARPLRWR